jgi:ribosomal protein S18 acetylase RimI-like enzyme
MIAGKIVKHSKKEQLKTNNFKIGEIDEIMVTKSYQKKGYGTMLIHKMENYFKSIGCDSIVLGVFAYNESAISFYEKHGYHVRSTTKIKKI